MMLSVRAEFSNFPQRHAEVLRRTYKGTAALKAKVAMGKSCVFSLECLEGPVLGICDQD